MAKLKTYRVGALCAGYGGIELGLRNLLRTELVWYSEIDQNASRVMEENFPGVPNLGDLTKIVESPPVEFGEVDIVTAGFPCQPVSLAAAVSKKKDKETGEIQRFRKAHKDEEGRWLIEDVCKVAKEAGATWLILENVPGLINWKPKGGRPQMAFEMVRKALRDTNYSRVEWGTYRASDIGAPHQRRRWFCLATCLDSEALETKQNHPIKREVSNRKYGEYPYFGYTEYGKRINKSVTIPLPPTLEKLVTLPTPTAREHKDSGPKVRFERISEKSGLTGVIMYKLCKEDEQVSFKGWKAWRTNQPKSYSNKQSVTPDFTPVIKRWEHIVQRSAPNPLREKKYGLLNPEFVEWMMGLPKGHVTSKQIALKPGPALKILGNGVVPQQAEYAISDLIKRMDSRTHD